MSNNNNSNISVSVRDTDTKVRMVVTSVSGHERTDTIMSLSDLNNLITTLCDARNEAQNSVSNLWKSVGSTIQAGRDR